MDRQHRKDLLKLKSECTKFAEGFNRKCEDFFQNISIKGSNMTSYFNTIHDLKLKTYEEFFEDAKISKNACKIIF